MKLEAVKNNGCAIGYIKNPTEEICLEAVKNDGLVIRDIDNPTHKVKLESVKSNGYAIGYIENPTEEICLEAVKKCGAAIKYIENPTNEMKLEAIKNAGWAIGYIENPTKEMIVIPFLKRTGISIEDIDMFLKGQYDIKDKKIVLKERLGKYKENKGEGCIGIYETELVAMQDYLMQFNNNEFILDCMVDMEILKKIALSNNELILYDDERLTPDHKKIANKIIS